MPHAVTWFDRARIEWTVWGLDQRLYDLPRSSRIAKRREVRANLLTAAADVGVSEALRHLGNGRQLAQEYRDAEFGDDPRPSWIAAGLFFFTGQLIFFSLLTDASLAFADGIKAADPSATGTFTWSGIRYLQETVTVTFVNGEATTFGGASSPVAWVIWIVATVLVGRLWRVVPVWSRARARSHSS
jgi:hypothetical protein